MAENIFEDAKISDKAWEAVKIGNAPNRPNAKTAYGSGRDANQTKALFDSPAELVKNKHNNLVESLAGIGEAEAERNSEFETKELERKSIFEENEAARQEEFDNEKEERKKAFDDFFNELDIVQTPGDSESAVMSQKATTDLAKMITKCVDVTCSPGEEETVPFAGMINLSGVYWGGEAWRTTDYIPVNESSTIKSNEWMYGNTSTVPTVTFYDADKNFISNILNDGTNGNYFTIDTTPPEGARYVRLTFLASQKSNWIRVVTWIKAVTEDNIAHKAGNSKEKIMSQKATTDYVKEYVPKVASRNLANLIFEHGHIVLGEFRPLTSGKKNAASQDYIEVKGDTSYNFSCDPTTLATASRMHITMYDSKKTFIKEQFSSMAFIGSDDGMAVKTATDCEYIRIGISAEDESVAWQDVIPSRLQIVEGSKTEYIPPMIIDPALLDLSQDAVFNYSAYGLPVLEFEGDITGISKDNAVTLSYKYGDRTGSCTLKWQGSSSLTYPKKNYTVKFDNAFEAKEGWDEHEKYCLKANYIDFSHSRNICSAKLWGGMVKSRTLTDENEELLKNLNALPNGGAIDGFPICVVINGEYKGIYTFNIPKDGWMFGMGNEDKTKQMAILCANASTAEGSSACCFHSLATVTEADLEIEYATDENNTAWINTSVNRLIQACILSDGTDLDTTIAQYLDWESAIDYYIFCLITQNFDGITKNYLLVTYDGEKWFFSAYDLDSTFGLYATGKRLMPNDGSGGGYAQCTVNSMGHRVFELIRLYKADELKARYKSLMEGRAGAFGKPLSEDRVVDTFYNFAGSIPKGLLDEEVKLWPTLPSTSVNNVSQIIDHYRRRRAFIDPQIEALQK